MIGEFLDRLIAHHTIEILERREVPEDNVTLVKTDGLAEVIEKLIILNIRVWMLEDKISEFNESDKDLANIKRKLDSQFKVKRPALVQAINLLIDDSIISGKANYEDNVKLYKDVLDENG